MWSVVMVKVCHILAGLSDSGQSYLSSIQFFSRDIIIGSSGVRKDFSSCPDSGLALRFLHSHMANDDKKDDVIASLTRHLAARSRHVTNEDSRESTTNYFLLFVLHVLICFLKALSSQSRHTSGLFRKWVRIRFDWVIFDHVPGLNARMKPV